MDKTVQEIYDQFIDRVQRNIPKYILSTYRNQITNKIYIDVTDGHLNSAKVYLQQEFPDLINLNIFHVVEQETPFCCATKEDTNLYIRGEQNFDPDVIQNGSTLVNIRLPADIQMQLRLVKWDGDIDEKHSNGDEISSNQGQYAITKDSSSFVYATQSKINHSDGQPKGCLKAGSYINLADDKIGHAYISCDEKINSENYFNKYQQNNDFGIYLAIYKIPKEILNFSGARACESNSAQIQVLGESIFKILEISIDTCEEIETRQLINRINGTIFKSKKDIKILFIEGFAERNAKQFKENDVAGSTIVCLSLNSDGVENVFGICLKFMRRYKYYACEGDPIVYRNVAVVLQLKNLNEWTRKLAFLNKTKGKANGAVAWVNGKNGVTETFADMSMSSMGRDNNSENAAGMNKPGDNQGNTAQQPISIEANMKDIYKKFCSEFSRISEHLPSIDFVQTTYPSQKRQKIFINVNKLFLNEAEVFFKTNLKQFWDNGFLEIVGQEPMIHFYPPPHQFMAFAECEPKALIQVGNRIIGIPFPNDFTTSLIESKFDGGLEKLMDSYMVAIGSGTSGGFLIDENDQPYLFTARHVLKGEIFYNFPRNTNQSVNKETLPEENNNTGELGVPNNNDSLINSKSVELDSSPITDHIFQTTENYDPLDFKENHFELSISDSEVEEINTFSSTDKSMSELTHNRTCRSTFMRNSFNCDQSPPDGRDSGIGMGFSRQRGSEKKSENKFLPMDLKDQLIDEENLNIVRPSPLKPDANLPFDLMTHDNTNMKTNEVLNETYSKTVSVKSGIVGGRLDPSKFENDDCKDISTPEINLDNCSTYKGKEHLQPVSKTNDQNLQTEEKLTHETSNPNQPVPLVPSRRRKSNNGIDNDRLFSVAPGTEPINGSIGEKLQVLTEISEDAAALVPNDKKVYSIGSEYFGYQGVCQMEVGTHREVDFALVKVDQEMRCHPSLKLDHTNNQNDKVNLHIYNGTNSDMYNRHVQKDGITTNVTTGTVLPLELDCWIRPKAESSLQICCTDNFGIQSLENSGNGTKRPFSLGGDSGSLITSVVGSSTEGTAYGLVIKGMERYFHYSEEEDGQVAYDNVSIGMRLDHCLELAQRKWGITGLRLP